MDRWVEYDQGIRTEHAIQEHELVHYTAQTQPDEHLVYEHNREIQNNPRLRPKKLLGNVPKVLYDKMVKENPDLRSPDREIRTRAWFRAMFENPECAAMPKSAFIRKPGEGKRPVYFRFT